MTRSQKKGSQRLRSYAPWIVGGALLAIVLAGSLRSLRPASGSDAQGLAIGRVQTQDFHSLEFSALDPETVFFGHHGGLLVSTDGGREWSAGSLQNADAMALAAPPGNPQIMYAAGHNVFFKSLDGGGSWAPVGASLPGLDIHGFAADPANADRVYAHVVGFGLFRSDNGGEDWELLTANVAFLNLGVGESPETLYATAAQNGLFHSMDGGANWSRLAGPPGEGTIALAYDRDSDRLYVTTFGVGAGLYVSDDRGGTWTPLGLEATVMAVALSPLDPQHLIAVDDSGWVYASGDGGVTWGDE